MPLRNPRRIFVRQPRRTGLRAAGLFVACCATVLLVAHPLVSALARMLDVQAVSGPLATPHKLAADDVAVMDGQTLRVAGHVVRLDGVAAPKRGEGCAAGADCAGTAALHLAALVRDQRVACQLDGADPTGRAVARCEAGGKDINFALVASGWAEARGDAPALKEAETAARAQHLGLWAQR